MTHGMENFENQSAASVKNDGLNLLTLTEGGTPLRWDSLTPGSGFSCFAFGTQIWRRTAD